MSILDEYVPGEPTAQHILDIFKGEWSSDLSGLGGLVAQPGTAKLFEDGRVEWAQQMLGAFTDCRILELGPLEGGHTYMLYQCGARHVRSIEANTRAFLKCLCVKEIFKLDRVEFLLGDFVSFLQKDRSRYDMVFASGVLYHMDQPVELLELISRVSDKVFLWTHYYDQQIISGRRELVDKFSERDQLEYGGEVFEYASQAYKKALDWTGFCGGPKSTSKWLTRDSILRGLARYGFSKIEIGFDDPHHPNGPAFALCAQKEGPAGP